MLPQGIDTETGRELLRLTYNNKMLRDDNTVLRNKLARAEHEASAASDENALLRKTLEGMLASRSWKITKPLRALTAGLKFLRQSEIDLSKTSAPEQVPETPQKAQKPHHTWGAALDALCWKGGRRQGSLCLQPAPGI